RGVEPPDGRADARRPCHPCEKQRSAVPPDDAQSPGRREDAASGRMSIVDPEAVDQPGRLRVVEDRDGATVGRGGEYRWQAFCRRGSESLGWPGAAERIGSGDARHARRSVQVVPPEHVWEALAGDLDVAERQAVALVERLSDPTTFRSPVGEADGLAGRVEAGAPERGGTPGTVDTERDARPRRLSVVAEPFRRPPHP